MLIKKSDPVKTIPSQFLSFFLLYGLLFVFFSCSTGSSLEKQIAEIPVKVTFDRFDQKFFNAPKDSFISLKAEYGYLFPEQYPDSIWKKRQRDSLQVILQKEISSVFPSLDPFKDQLVPLLQHIKHYFPSSKEKKIVTVTNNVDYQNKTVYTDSLILISLDTYLGANNPLYEGIPQYIVRDMDIAYFSAHLADEFAISVVPEPEDRTLLAQMVYYGKKHYLKDLLLPKTADGIKISYTQEEINWVNENERFIWQYFIENELLYKTQSSYLLRFIEPAPFSKFYLEIDNESPGKIGQWIGWQIVRAYASKNTSLTINQLLQTPAMQIFSGANYKPQR